MHILERNVLSLELKCKWIFGDYMYLHFKWLLLLTLTDVLSFCCYYSKNWPWITYGHRKAKKIGFVVSFSSSNQFLMFVCPGIWVRLRQIPVFQWERFKWYQVALIVQWQRSQMEYRRVHTMHVHTMWYNSFRFSLHRFVMPNQIKIKKVT